VIPVLDIGKNSYTSSWLRDVNASAIPTEDCEFIAYFMNIISVQKSNNSEFSMQRNSETPLFVISFGGKCSRIFLLELEKQVNETPEELNFDRFTLLPCLWVIH
jgi:hypothetical protein